MKNLKDQISKLLDLYLLPLLFCMLIPLIVSCNMLCPEKEEIIIPAQEEAKASILEKIEKANKLWASGNPLGFVEVAAADVTWMDDLGAGFPITGRDSLKVYCQSFEGQIPPHKHKLSDMYFQFYDDIVIITYRYTGTFDDIIAAPWKVTSVYRYFDGEWYSVHENWTEVKTLPNESN